MGYEKLEFLVAETKPLLNVDDFLGYALTQTSMLPDSLTIRLPAPFSSEGQNKTSGCCGGRNINTYFIAAAK